MGHQGVTTTDTRNRHALGLFAALGIQLVVEIIRYFFQKYPLPKKPSQSHADKNKSFILISCYFANHILL
jgi:hypothetical protein